MDYIGIKIYKPLDDEKLTEYKNIAEWCNETQSATIEDRGDYYECVKPRVLTLEELRQNKLAQLNILFEEQVSGAFTCSLGWPMQFNRSDTLAVEGAIQLLKSQNEHTGYLTDANDETHYGVPLETMETVKLEMLQAYARCHAHKQELRKSINNAQSKEELAEITISWPV